MKMFMVFIVVLIIILVIFRKYSSSTFYFDGSTVFYGYGRIAFPLNNKNRICPNDEELIKTNVTHIWVDIDKMIEKNFSKNLRCEYYPYINSTNGEEITNTTILHNNAEEFFKPVESNYPSTEVTCIQNHSTVVKKVFPIIESKTISWTLPDNEHEQRPSVLIIGLDSISKEQVSRLMPKTTEFLHSRQAIEIKGLIKTSSSNFESLFGLLTGAPYKTLEKLCDNKDLAENCDFMWNEFKNHGYITAFGEDAAYLRPLLIDDRNISKHPTDYFLLPFMLLNEATTPYCNNNVPVFEKLFDCTKTFLSSMSQFNSPFFGIFWGDSLLDNVYHVVPNVDKTIFSLFQTLNDTSLLNRTVVLFLNELAFQHKTLFGFKYMTHDLRQPFAYILAPKWMEQKHATAFKNLLQNQNKTTTIFDLSSTIRNLLNITALGKYYTHNKGKSLFSFPN